MDPILEGRPGNAIYQAPMYDSLVGFDIEKVAPALALPKPGRCPRTA
jgi:hypothetical protein